MDFYGAGFRLSHNMVVRSWPTNAIKKFLAVLLFHPGLIKTPILPPRTIIPDCAIIKI